MIISEHLGQQSFDRMRELTVTDGPLAQTSLVADCSSVVT